MRPLRSASASGWSLRARRLRDTKDCHLGPRQVYVSAATGTSSYSVVTADQACPTLAGRLRTQAGFGNSPSVIQLQGQLNDETDLSRVRRSIVSAANVKPAKSTTARIAVLVTIAKHGASSSAPPGGYHVHACGSSTCSTDLVGVTTGHGPLQT